MEEYDEIDLSRLLEICIKNIVLIIVSMMLCSTLAYVITTTLMEKQYTASSRIVIVSNNTNKTDSISNEYNAILLSQKLTDTYKEIMLSEVISNAVIHNLDLDSKYGYTTETYEEVVSVSSVNSTEVMDITVKTNDPYLSASIANEVVNIFMKKIPTIMNIDNVTLLNNAKVPDKPSGPSVLKNTVIGCLIGLFISLLYCLIILLTDTKVKTEEEVKKIFDYPIIGIIPDYDEEDVR